jgi:hypothetical protein
MITTLDDVTEYPLCWPETKPRVAQRRASPFVKTTLAKSLREIEDEMRRYGARRYVVSMSPAYRRGPSDPAVAVWFEIKSRGASVPSLRVIACDSYLRVEDNAHAVALTLQGLRTFERYGTYTQEQALEGARLALPPPDDGLDWHAVLGVVPAGLDKTDALAIVNGRYRRLAAEANGDDKELRRLNLAIEKARQELGAV